MRQTRTGLMVAGMAAAVMLSACGGGGGAAAPVNAAPVARAGTAQSVTAGATVTLNGAGSSDADGSIAGYVWTQTAGTSVTLSGASTAGPSFVTPQVVTPSTLTFSLVVTDNSGAVSAGSAVTITVNPLAGGNVSVTGNVRFERVEFRRTFPVGLDYANPVLQPARGVMVRAVNSGTLAVLAAGVTDASGAYSLTVTANTSIAIQVVAQMQRDNTQPLPRWDVRVQDGIPGTTPYTFTTAAFNSSAGAQNIDIPTGISANGTAAGVRASGPFAVLDTIYTAMQTVLGVTPTAAFPALVVDWGTQVVGTRFSVASGVQFISLVSDLGEDADEFDRHVVAHEFGHYVEYNFSRSDSIGGSHGFGDKLDIRVAFGEGYGYAFAAIVLNDPIVLDSFVLAGTQRASGFNVEANPPASGESACWCSEASVWSIIWDLYDGTPDGNDNISLGFEPIWQVLTNAQRTTPARTSIFPFIAALNAARPADAASINLLVSAQSIVALNNPALAIDPFATNETHEPLAAPDSALPVYPNIQLGVPLVTRSVDSAGRHNKLGNHRLLKFTPVASGNVTVTLTTSNAAADRDPDFVVYRAGTRVSSGTDTSAEYPETETFSVTAGTTYIIDAYDCANGCSTELGTPGDYDLTVTIN